SPGSSSRGWGASRTSARTSRSAVGGSPSSAATATGWPSCASPHPPRRPSVSSDLLALLAAVLLLLLNAFFVAAEFSLVSARRDRLEAMAQAGTAGASTVLKASTDLSRML